MQKVASNILSVGVIFDIAAGDLDGGEIGNYPIWKLPVNAILFGAIFCPLVDFVSAGGGAFTIGSPLNASLYYFEINMTNFAVGEVYTISGDNGHLVDSTGIITLAINTAAYTAGKGRVDIQYLFPQ